MKRLAVVGWMGLVLISGCVAKGDYEKAVRERDECRAQLEQADQRMEGFRAQYESALQDSKATAEDFRNFAQTTRSDVEEKFRHFKVNLPEEVQKQVDSQLSELSRAVAAEFTKVGEQNAALAQKLDLASESIEAIHQETVGSNQLRGEMKETLSGVSERARDMIGRIQEYDRTRLLCKKCDEYLGLRKKKASDVETFHQELVSTLSKMQTDLAGQ